MGIAKALFALEKKADAAETVIDRDFIREHTHGFDEFAAVVEACPWSAIAQRSRLSRGALEAAAYVYARAKSVMFV
jgi:anaerobic selenocysteine-containing dehydrogenase